MTYPASTCLGLPLLLFWGWLFQPSLAGAQAPIPGDTVITAGYLEYWRMVDPVTDHVTQFIRAEGHELVSSNRAWIHWVCDSSPSESLREETDEHGLRVFVQLGGSIARSVTGRDIGMIPTPRVVQYRFDRDQPLGAQVWTYRGMSENVPRLGQSDLGSFFVPPTDALDFSLRAGTADQLLFRAHGPEGQPIATFAFDLSEGDDVFHLLPCLSDRPF